MSTLTQDLRFAFRQLNNAPVFALTAVLTLALGIGINAAMFSVVDQVLLRAMPFPRANEVVQMGVRSASGGFSATSFPDIQDWQARSHSFQQIAYYTIQVPTLGGTSNPRIMPQIVSSTNLFDMLEVRPMMGRAFLPTDSAPGQTNVVILSAGTWGDIYHSDPQIIGRSVPINGIPYTVVGIMPRGFAFPSNTGDTSIWTPLPVQDKALQDRSSSALSVIGRLRPGITLADATHEMDSIHTQLLHEYPKDEDVSPMHVELYSNVVTGSARPSIIALNVAVIAVWLIACANIAGLLLARGNSRRREIALRTALGAQRGRLIRQFLTESLLLSLAGFSSTTSRTPSYSATRSTSTSRSAPSSLLPPAFRPFSSDFFLPFTPPMHLRWKAFGKELQHPGPPAGRTGGATLLSSARSLSLSRS